MKMQYFIDVQKASTLFFILLMMAIFNQWGNTTAWIYLAMHGSYGFLWVLKGQLFPDKQWRQKRSLLFAFIGTLALCLYWVAPWLLTSRAVHAPHWLISASIAVYAFGLFLHFTSDMQKYVSLKIRPNQLLKDGLWSKVRNPNYLGELLIYSSFAALSMHWISFLILGIWVGFYWLPLMRRKDASLSRYPDFPRYKKQTKLLLPFIF